MADSDVEVQFGASTSDLDAATDEAKGKIGEFGEAVDGLKEHFDGVADTLKDFAGAVGIAFGVDAFVEWVKSSAELGEQLEHTAVELGITAEQASQLRAEAMMTGTSFDTMQVQLERMQLELASSDSATSHAAQSLRVLGINAQQFARLSINQQIEQLSESFSKFADGPTKTAAAMALLGRGGAQMLPFLDRGKEGFDELNDVMARTGVVMSDDMVASFAKTKDDMNEMSLAWQGLSEKIFNVANPAFDAIIQKTTQFIEQLKASDVRSAIQDMISAGADFAVAFGAFTNDAIGDWQKLMAVLNAPTPDVGSSLKASFQEFTIWFAQHTGGSKEAIDGIKQDLADTEKELAPSDLSQVFANIDQQTNAATARLHDEVLGYRKEISGLFANPTGGASLNVNQIRQQFGLAAEAMKPIVPQMQLGGGSDEALQSAMKEADGEVQAYQDAEKQKQELIEEEVKTKQISAQQGQVAVQDALQDELQDTQDTYQAELGLDNLKASQRQEILNKMQQAEQKYNQAVQQLAIKSAEQTVQEWQKGFQEINSAFDGQISGLLKGTTSWATAFQNVLTQLTTDVIKFFVNMALQWAENEALQIAGIGRVTAAQEAGSAAQASAQSAGAAAGAAAQAGNILGALVSDAKATFGGVFAFLSPVLGPAAAGPAAAASSTVLAGGLAVGAWDVPHDMPVQLHKDEMVVPAGVTPWAKGILAAGGQAGGSSGGNAYHQHNWNVNVHQTNDPQAVVDAISDNARRVGKILGRQFNLKPA